MKLNTLSKLFATKGSFYLSYNQATALFLGLLAAIASAVWGGYQFASWRIPQNQDGLIGQMSCIQSGEARLATDPVTEQHLQVLTEHVGRIEANLMRINALGERLVETAHLDPQEFNFGQEVPMGGPLSELKDQLPLMQTIKELDAVLTKRYTQMNTLHLALQTRLGQQELSLFGSGKPVNNGWISSFFGARHDPITGRRAWHAGVDIVGKEGAEIKALAGGVVSYADVKGGYGQLVEIKHADGLSTRYGHNKEILVKPGELVKKGQVIALLGSTGRSTGPHLHLEVHRFGEAVDPGHYFPNLRKQ